VLLVAGQWVDRTTMTWRAGIKAKPKWPVFFSSERSDPQARPGMLVAREVLHFR
jgi:hypothetical protein